MSMEKKLAEYRAKQEKSEKIKLYRNKIQKFFSSLIAKKNEYPKNDRPTEIEKDQGSPPENLLRLSCMKKRKNMEIPEEKQDLIVPDDVISLDEESMSDDDSLMCCSWLQLLQYFLYFILWGTIYMIFIKLEFGFVYVILSALIFMYVNTRTVPRRNGEMSAYSVFNKNCVSIDGTLKAEQFEREIIYGAGSIR